MRFAYQAPSPVVNGVSGALARGRLTALVGPNAAGKSTLVKLMVGLLTPQDGNVVVGGAAEASGEPTANAKGRGGGVRGPRVKELTATQRARHLVYVPQRGSVQFAFSVRQVISMGRFAFFETQRMTDHAAQWAMRVCELEPLADRPVGELSGGQQQRVTLARALAQGRADRSRGTHARSQASWETGEGLPVVMLLDEPASSMDLWHAHRTLGLLRQWVRVEPNRAALVVLHDLNLALRWVDDAWLMDQGRLQAAGPWHEVLTPERLEPIYGIKMQRTGGSAHNEPDRKEPGHDEPAFADSFEEHRPVLMATPSATIRSSFSALMDE